MLLYFEVKLKWQYIIKLLHVDRAKKINEKLIQKSIQAREIHKHSESRWMVHGGNDL